ncbi:MAG: energy-coupling factor transporter transmembrane protein EcfT [Desulfobacterota bacterium]|nr:energy-coupling factor transporter transmembrane protein EcfT [Thermodesulfobacteriota bacterium]
MARIALHYFPKDSFLHRWDARCKFLGFLMITGTLVYPKTTWLLFDSILLAALLMALRFPLRYLLREMRFWGILLLILFLFQSLGTTGTRVPFLPFLPFSKEGLMLGGMTCWRMGLILLYAILFTAVTRPRELRDGLTWFLKPVPFLSGRRIGLMASLTLRFFSRILDHADEVHLANKARRGDRAKNPIKRIKFIVLPLLRRSFYEAEELTWALAARGYREDLPLTLSKLPLRHLLPLAILLVLLLSIEGLLS